jgi:hypothetical protein
MAEKKKFSVETVSLFCKIKMNLELIIPFKFFFFVVFSSEFYETIRSGDLKAKSLTFSMPRIHSYSNEIHCTAILS